MVKSRAKTSGTTSRARPAPRRPARRQTLGAPGLRWLLAAGIVAALLAVAGVVWAVGRDGKQPAAVSIEHVHGLGVNPVNGALYAATHNGLYQLPTGTAASRVGVGEQDTMGFAIVGPDRFLGSGHPAPGQDGPPQLGLIESTDGGATWTNRSLAGQADFHALRYRHGTVYGHNSATGQLIVSRDQTTWDTRSTIALRDFVVSPDSPGTLLATTQQGVQRSADGGRTWAPTAGPPLVLLDWQSDDGLWGVTATGEVLRSADGGAAWRATGRIDGTVTAFAATGVDLYAAVHERGIFHSGDGGTTWTQRYP